jgi:exonuclease III
VLLARRQGYSGVALHVSKSFAPERPGFAHPPFDYETRIATVEIGDSDVASVYVPNGGRTSRQDAVPRGAGRLRRALQGRDGDWC